jgi:hypothetical protein
MTILLLHPGNIGEHELFGEIRSGLSEPDFLFLLGLEGCEHTINIIVGLFERPFVNELLVHEVVDDIPMDSPHRLGSVRKLRGTWTTMSATRLSSTVSKSAFCSLLWDRNRQV